MAGKRWKTAGIGRKWVENGRNRQEIGRNGRNRQEIGRKLAGIGRKKAGNRHVSKLLIYNTGLFEIIVQGPP